MTLLGRRASVRALGRATGPGLLGCAPGGGRVLAGGAWRGAWRGCLAGCVCPWPRSAGPVCHKPHWAGVLRWGACAPGPVVRGLCATRPKRGRRRAIAPSGLASRAGTRTMRALIMAGPGSDGRGCAGGRPRTADSPRRPPGHRQPGHHAGLPGKGETQKLARCAQRRCTSEQVWPRRAGPDGDRGPGRDPVAGLGHGRGDAGVVTRVCAVRGQSALVADGLVRRGPERIPGYGGRQRVSRSGSCPWHGRRSRSC